MAIRLPEFFAPAFAPAFATVAVAVLIGAVSLALSPAALADHHEGADDGHGHATQAAAAPAPGQVREFKSGVHYEELLVPLTVSDPDTIEVTEMFSYMCIHCFNFDAAVHVWSERLPEDVTFKQVPAIFNKVWGLFAQAFYTAEALGVSDKTHDALFAAVHNQRRDLRTPDAMAGLFKEAAGVEKEAFLKAFNSFSVRSKVQQADSRARQARLSSVPTLIVAGKYKTDSSKAGTNNGMLQVANFLIEKERKARNAGGSGTTSSSEANSEPNSETAAETDAAE